MQLTKTYGRRLQSLLFRIQTLLQRKLRFKSSSTFLNRQAELRIINRLTKSLQKDKNFNRQMSADIQNDSKQPLTQALQQETTIQSSLDLHESIACSRDKIEWRQTPVQEVLQVKDSNYSDKFQSEVDRVMFFVKTFALVSAQFFITALVVLIPLCNRSASKWIERYWGIIFVAIIEIMLTTIFLLCFRGKMNSFKYVLFSVFTIGEGYLFAFIAANSDPPVVLATSLVITSVALAISIYAFVTKKELTVRASFIMLIVFIVSVTIGFILIFRISTGQWRTNKMLVVCFAVFLYSLYLIFDIKLIMGGKRYNIDADNYISGAIILQTDIFTVFFYLLGKLSGH